MPISLGEGNTPLAASVRLAPGAVWFKFESTNPSGSYKDRFIATEVARLAARGVRTCVATSSGNTGAALATFGARAGMRAVIFVNADAPEGKLMQMRAHGATVVRVPRFAAAPEVTSGVFAQLETFTREGAALVVSAFAYCPEGMAGVEGIARELRTQLPDAAHVFVPVGGGGLYAAVCQGYGAGGPRVHAVQPLGCPTLLNAVSTGQVDAVQSTTRVSGLSVPFDIDASLALRRLRECGGAAIGVSDEEVFLAQLEMLREEGICAEPAGATAFAGYRQALARGLVRPGEQCVCLVTGHGWKDPASLAAVADTVESPLVEGPEVLDWLRASVYQAGMVR